MGLYLGGADWTDTAHITGLDAALNLKAPLASPTFTGTVGGVTAAMVGLGSANNTADSAKPVSTAQAAAVSAAKARANHTGTQSADTLTAGTTNKLYVAADVTKLASLSVVPPGQVSMFAAAVAPTGYLLCQGQLVSRTTYAALYAVVGTTFGVGDGSTTFAVPNLKGRVPVGLDSTQTEFDVMGEVGGAKTHTLSTAEMPTHSHNGVTGSANPVSHRKVHGAGTGAANNHFTGWDGTQGYSDFTSDIYPMSVHTHNIPSDGGGGAHNNLQPYIVLNYIIKT